MCTLVPQLHPPRSMRRSLAPVELGRTNALGHALRSALLKELEACLALVSDDTIQIAVRIHDARTHLKRWRALLKLEHEPTRHALAREGKVLQHVARRLGDLRDADARLEAWKELSTEENSSEFAQQVLERARSDAFRGVRASARIARAEQALRAVVPCVQRELSLANGESKAIFALIAGAKYSYRKARRALARALAGPSTKTLHALRRANKAEQYQLQFFELLWEKPLHAQRKQTAKLSELLGSHHDLSAIAAILQAEAGQQPFARFGALRKIDDRRAELEHRALHLGRLLYAERPRSFQRRIARYIEVCLEDDALPRPAAAQ